jgi:hypothetical protein
MLVSLWRRWWRATSVPARKKGLSGGRNLTYRPQIEALEGRAVPALWGSTLSGLVPIANAGSTLQHTSSTVPAGIAPLLVTVSQNASESVLDLGPVFAAMPGLQHKAGLHLTILGNTNGRLVTPDLSGSALTLTYARGLSGSATITVNATDADGVCAQQTVVVTVRPLSTMAGAGGVRPGAPPKPATPRGLSG